MILPLFINKSEYDLIQNYLRLNLDQIKFDGEQINNEQFKAFKSLNNSLNSIDFDLF